MFLWTRARHTPRTIVRTGGRRPVRRNLIRDLLWSVENGHRTEGTTGEDPRIVFLCDVETAAGRLAP